jgi:hypothetical protein
LPSCIWRLHDVPLLLLPHSLLLLLLLLPQTWSLKTSSFK